jgi:hypothetical protein
MKQLACTDYEAFFSSKFSMNELVFSWFDHEDTSFWQNISVQVYYVHLTRNRSILN